MVEALSFLMFKRAGFLVLAVAFSLAFGVGCGASGTGEKSGVRSPASPSSISVGYAEGDRIIPFAVQLVNGGIVTSDDLLKQNRPTFVIFFKPD
jgi:cytochrome oxidase Cu insertion factor (SCO1/SenC/PrrC family)